ncbi:unnamed protein product [Vitrella brassicaformis CCMP3155]|uniref:Uncharacterized protein n=1 Tax=Vitrella brassicaformis (strain CCMP3155) TaxID=1169540 RepID=A0A0G4EBT5_VITBC|nr:unnamed protein product [Vitrella brassicaformis CCMP3155]|eukprot:CEL93439.1 unnamed protein product [Vitrella brassicaformis CCMP3155]
MLPLHGACSSQSTLDHDGHRITPGPRAQRHSVPSMRVRYVMRMDCHCSVVVADTPVGLVVSMVLVVCRVAWDTLLATAGCRVSWCLTGSHLLRGAHPLYLGAWVLVVSCVGCLG